MSDRTMQQQHHWWCSQRQALDLCLRQAPTLSIT